MYFSHNTQRNVAWSFEQFFKGLEVKRHNKKGEVSETIKVPISWAPKERGVVVTNSQPDNQHKVGAVIPCMTYEYLNLRPLYLDKNNRNEKIQTKYLEADVYDNSQYDNSDGTPIADLDDRVVYQVTDSVYYIQYKDNGIKLRSDKDGNIGLRTHFVDSFSPVIYNLDFHLYITTRTQSDTNQIIEQILPKFTPDFNFNLNLFPDLNLDEPIFVPMTLANVNTVNDWEGAINKDRYIQTTIMFSSKIPFFLPFKSPNNIIFKTLTNIKAVAEEKYFTGEAVLIATNETKVVFNVRDENEELSDFVIENEWLEFYNNGSDE